MSNGCEYVAFGLSASSNDVMVSSHDRHVTLQVIGGQMVEAYSTFEHQMSPGWQNKPVLLVSAQEGCGYFWSSDLQSGRYMLESEGHTLAATGEGGEAEDEGSGTDEDASFGFGLIPLFNNNIRAPEWLVWIIIAYGGFQAYRAARGNKIGILNTLSIPAAGYLLYKQLEFRGVINVSKEANAFKVDVRLTPETKKVLNQSVIGLSAAMVAAAIIRARG